MDLPWKLKVNCLSSVLIPRLEKKDTASVILVGNEFASDSSGKHLSLQSVC